MPDDVMDRARELLAAELYQSPRMASAIKAGASRDEMDKAALRAIAAALTETAALRAEIERAREAGEREGIRRAAEAVAAHLVDTDSVTEELIVRECCATIVDLLPAQPDREVANGVR